MGWRPHTQSYVADMKIQNMAGNIELKIALQGQSLQIEVFFKRFMGNSRHNAYF